MFSSKTERLLGHAAPPFKLQAQDGTTVDLATFRGQKRVILAFYPEDDTPG